MTTSTAYAALVRQLDAGGFPVVPEPLAHARAALLAAEEAMRQVDAFAPLRPVALAPEGGVVLGRVSAAGPAALAEVLALRLAEGESLPDDLVQQSYAAVVRDAQAAAADTVARLLAVEVVRTFDRVADESVPALRDGLRVQLDELVTTARRLGAGLDGYDVTQPAGLVAAPDRARKAYALLGDLAEQYATLRAAQRTLEPVEDAQAYNVHERMGVTELQDALELWDWREAERDRQAAFPWPADPRARLLFVTSRRPWVPGNIAALVAAARQVAA